MNALKAIIWITVVVTITTVLFYHYSDTWIIRGIGFFFVLCLFSSIWRTATIMGVNRLAHGNPKGTFLPLLERREILGFFRQYAESAEDRVFSIINSYATLILLMGLFIHIWWLCVAAILVSFSLYHALRRSWPGYALILGGSNSESTRQITLLVTELICPLFATNLLNMISNDEIEHEIFKATSYRLKNKVVSWRSAVEVHAAFARIILVDITEITEAVREELGIISDSKFQYKLIVFDKLRQFNNTEFDEIIDRNACYVVHSDDELVELIGIILKDIQSPPSMELPLTKLVANKAN